jgi:hypothetical protein
MEHKKRKEKTQKAQQIFEDSGVGVWFLRLLCLLLGFLCSFPVGRFGSAENAGKGIVAANEHEYSQMKPVKGLPGNL